jgi:hypothetical protein
LNCCAVRDDDMASSTSSRIILRCLAGPGVLCGRRPRRYARRSQRRSRPAPSSTRRGTRADRRNRHSQGHLAIGIARSANPASGWSPTITSTARASSPFGGMELAAQDGIDVHWAISSAQLPFQGKTFGELGIKVAEDHLLEFAEAIGGRLAGLRQIDPDN